MELSGQTLSVPQPRITWSIVMGFRCYDWHKKRESAPDIISNGIFPLIDFDTECLQKNEKNLNQIVSLGLPF
tara:strand:- start:380 stop:595 length:216 start_codon:yes stop_codon:yes gene_type:complete